VKYFQEGKRRKKKEEEKERRKRKMAREILQLPGEPFD